MVGDQVCLLPEKDVGGRVVDNFGEIVKAVGTQAVHIECGECADRV